MLKATFHQLDFYTIMTIATTFRNVSKRDYYAYLYGSYQAKLVLEDYVIGCWMGGGEI